VRSANVCDEPIAIFGDPAQEVRRGSHIRVVLHAPAGLPAESPPKQVIFRLLRDEEVLYEAELSPADFQTPEARSAANGSDQVVLTITTIAQLLSFAVTQRCLLKTRVLVDGKEFRGGALEASADALRVS
jgi:hypothetical protein